VSVKKFVICRSVKLPTIILFNFDAPIQEKVREVKSLLSHRGQKKGRRPADDAKKTVSITLTMSPHFRSIQVYCHANIKTLCLHKIANFNF